jgi:glycosyltransferase involved in cell wall biosynthesis
LLLPHLGGGGAEKVFALLAQSLSRDKYELHLGLVTREGIPVGAIPAGVTVHSLGCARVRTAGFRLLRLVRRLRPQVVLSGMYHLNFMVLLLRPFFPRATRVLVRQNGSVSAVLEAGEVPFYTRGLYRLLYRRADRVICQSAAMARDMVQALGIPSNRLVVPPNPVDVDAIRGAVTGLPNRWAGTGPHLLAAGRLSPEKGFDLLLRALVVVREKFPDARLVIAGTGPEEAALKGLCRALQLEPAVVFAGYVDRTAAWFRGAAAFVLSSRHEGMPNSMLEAAAAGLPIVALPAAGGVPDLLRGQPGTWLATEISAAALAACLVEALGSLARTERFTHSFIEPFRIQRAIAAYEAVIDATIERRASHAEASDGAAFRDARTDAGKDAGADTGTDAGTDTGTGTRERRL